MWGFNGNCKAGFSSWLSWSQVAKPKIEQRQRWPPWDVPSRLVRRLWRRWCVWRKMYTGIRNGLGVAIKISGEDKQKGIPTVLLVTLDIKCCWFWYIYIFLYFETTSFFVWGHVFAGVERVALPVGFIPKREDTVDGRNPKHHWTLWNPLKPSEKMGYSPYIYWLAGVLPVVCCHDEGMGIRCWPGWQADTKCHVANVPLALTLNSFELNFWRNGLLSFESLRISLSDVQVKVNDAMSESLEIKHD